MYTKGSGTSADLKGRLVLQPKGLVSLDTPALAFETSLLVDRGQAWRGSGQFSLALAKTMLCAQLCLGNGKDKGNGHFCSPLRIWQER